MKFRLMIVVLLFPILLSLTASATAGVIFVGESLDVNLVVTENAETTEGEFSDSVIFKQLVDEKFVTYSLRNKPFVTAESSFFGSDEAQIGAERGVESIVGISKKGEAPDVGLLRWKMRDINGTYRGSEGGSSSATVEIRGEIGDIIKRPFHDGLTISNDEKFSFNWDMGVAAGAFIVKPGDFVTPNFVIDNFDFSSFTRGFAEMENVWEDAVITMQLTDLPKEDGEMFWSYSPGVRETSIRVFATYPEGPRKPVFAGNVDEIPKSNKDRILPKNDAGLRPSDYEVEITTESTNTVTSMGFLVETPGNSFFKADLAGMTELFSGKSPFLVPNLFDAAGLFDLFVDIDLTEFLSFETSFKIGDLILFQNGKSNSMPGVYVGIKPNIFSSTEGIVLVEPFNGFGEILDNGTDGGVIPEPSTLSLFCFGSLVFGLYSWRCRKKEQQKGHPLASRNNQRVSQ